MLAHVLVDTALDIGEQEDGERHALCRQALHQSGDFNGAHAKIKTLNPHVQFSARQRRAYGLLTLTPECLQVQMRVIDDVFKEFPNVDAAAQFEVTRGNTRMLRLGLRALRDLQTI